MTMTDPVTFDRAKTAPIENAKRKQYGVFQLHILVDLVQ
jgi:hypothetical protein